MPILALLPMLCVCENPELVPIFLWGAVNHAFTEETYSFSIVRFRISVHAAIWDKESELKEKWHNIVSNNVVCTFIWIRKDKQTRHARKWQIFINCFKNQLDWRQYILINVFSFSLKVQCVACRDANGFYYIRRTLVQVSLFH